MNALEQLEEKQLDGYLPLMSTLCGRIEPDAAAKKELEKFLRRVATGYDQRQREIIGEGNIRELSDAVTEAGRAWVRWEGAAKVWAAVMKARTPAVRLAVIGRFWHPLGRMGASQCQEVRRLFAVLPHGMARILFNNEEERAALTALPAKLRVFCGSLPDAEANPSWSRDFQTALALAVHWSRMARMAGENQHPLILVGTVEKGDVWGLRFPGGSESEIIADPGRVEIAETVSVEDLLAGRCEGKALEWMMPEGFSEIAEKANELLRGRIRER